MVGLQAEDHAFGLRIMNRGAFPGKIGKGKKPAAASGNGGRDLSHGGIGIFAPGLLLRQQYQEQLITVPFGQSAARCWCLRQDNRYRESDKDPAECNRLMGNGPRYK